MFTVVDEMECARAKISAFSMDEEIIFPFIIYRFSDKPIPDIIEYDLHNPVFMWISNLPIDPDIHNGKCLRNCYDSDRYGRYVNRLQTVVSMRHIKEKTARVGSGHSKFGFYWFLLRMVSGFFRIIGLVFSWTGYRFFHRIGLWLFVGQVTGFFIGLDILKV